MKRVVTLVAAALCVFVIVAAAMLKLMPQPLKETDYLVIGSVATLVALAVMFVVLITTSMRARDVFFRRRKKP